MKRELHNLLVRRTLVRLQWSLSSGARYFKPRCLKTDSSVGVGRGTPLFTFSPLCQHQSSHVRFGQKLFSFNTKIRQNILPSVRTAYLCANGLFTDCKENCCLEDKARTERVVKVSLRLRPRYSDQGFHTRSSGCTSRCFVNSFTCK